MLPSHGAKVCRWIEANCIYGEGDYYGDPVRLREFQRSFVYRLYEYWPETGQRRYQRALLGMGKGNGKTPLAAWIAAAELGGPVAPPSPRVIVGAASLKQADLVFGDLRTVVKGPALAPYFDPQDLRILKNGGPGLAERIAAEAGTNDGARATAFIADELHEWTGRAGRVYMIAEGAIAKRRGAFSLAITTAGYEKDSVLGQLYDYGLKVASGETIDDGFLFEWYEAPDGLDLEDPEQWEEAVRAANPAAGDFNSIANIRARYDGALAMPRWEWERYHGNRWTSAPESWLPAGSWDARATRRQVADEPVALGFSGSHNSTSAALYGCTENGYVFELGAWEGNPVSRAEVNAAVTQAMRDLNVTRLACNPPGWDADIEKWAETHGEEVVVLWEIRKRTKFAEACGRFYTGVVTGQLTHDGSAALARHLRNARTKKSPDAPEGVYITGRDGYPITAAKAAVIAYEQASEPAGGEPSIRILGMEG